MPVECELSLGASFIVPTNGWEAITQRLCALGNGCNLRTDYIASVRRVFLLFWPTGPVGRALHGRSQIRHPECKMEVVAHRRAVHPFRRLARDFIGIGDDIVWIIQLHSGGEICPNLGRM